MDLGYSTKPTNYLGCHYTGYGPALDPERGWGVYFPIERFHSRDYRSYWFTETKESNCIKIEFNSQRFSLGHQHGRHFFVLGHQHGRRDVM